MSVACLRTAKIFDSFVMVFDLSGYTCHPGEATDTWPGTALSASPINMPQNRTQAEEAT